MGIYVSSICTLNLSVTNVIRNLIKKTRLITGFLLKY